MPVLCAFFPLESRVSWRRIKLIRTCIRGSIVNTLSNTFYYQQIEKYQWIVQEITLILRQVYRVNKHILTRCLAAKTFLPSVPPPRSKRSKARALARVLAPPRRVALQGRARQRATPTMVALVRGRPGGALMAALRTQARMMFAITSRTSR